MDDGRRTAPPEAGKGGTPAAVDNGTGLPQEDPQSGQAGDPRAEGSGPGAEASAAALAALQKERDSYYDLLLRKQAEFENFRRRSERERADARVGARQEVLRELLAVLDACDQGLRSMERHEADLEVYREGYLLLQRQIHQLLARFGVEKIEAAGQPFDPNVHEAVLYEPSDTHPEGQVIEEIKGGYRIQDRLLRPAQVKVARAPAPD